MRGTTRSRNEVRRSSFSMARHLLVSLLAMGSILFGQTDPPPTAAANSSRISQNSTPRPITARERSRWVIENTVGPASLAGGGVSAGWGTMFNMLASTAPTGQGFGDRCGMRLTGIATSNVMEAGLGSIWGEDPRYIRAPGETFGRRLGHAVKMAFLAHLMPAYARCAAITGNNYLSNTWRADSEATFSRASVRVGLGFVGRIGGNIWSEVWPDVKEG